tara:strand:+ start:290 stop:1357 length:1068 start_codon:yes stop_codon:yes gene_type:complete
MEKNRDLFKQAIAEAKAVKEVSIANAKAALEEVITPRLKSMFEQKLTEMEEEEEKHMEETESLEEEFNLEELLAELDEAEEEEVLDTEEAEEEESEEEESEEVEDEDVDIDFDNMTEEDLRAFIEEVVDEMIEANELEMEDSEEEDSEEEEIESEEGEIEGEEEISMEPEMEEPLNETSWTETAAMLPTILTGFSALTGGTIGLSVWQQNALDGKYGEKWKQFAEKLSGAGASASAVREAVDTIETLRTELNEVNLLNSKLLYLNKILKETTLKGSDKVKTIAAFDKAETVKEVKLVYETLQNNLTKVSPKEVTKKLVRESKNFASSTIAGTSPRKPVMEVDPTILRMQKLAGLI